jgi:hypothetical protein
MEWIDVKDRIPEYLCVLMVKRENGSIEKVNFHHDQMQWLSFYTKEKLSHFQSCETNRFLHDVTHWAFPQACDKEKL